MSRPHDAHFTGLFVAQSARKANGAVGTVAAQRIVDPQVAGSIPAQPATLRLPAPLECDVQEAILELLQHHPRVAWAVRMNTGGAWLPGNSKKEGHEHEQFVRFAFPGCSDIIGQLSDGRFLAIEVKRMGKNPTDEQRTFLERVNAYHGIGFVARSVDDVMTYLRRLT